MQIPYENEFSTELVEQFNGFVQKTMDIFKKNLKDKTIPLETRWKAYLTLRKYLDTDSYYWSPKSIEKHQEISWYDDFYLERGEVQKLDDDFVQKACKKFTSVDVESLKEEILQYGYGAFENDW